MFQNPSTSQEYRYLDSNQGKTVLGHSYSTTVGHCSGNAIAPNQFNIQ